MHRGRRTGESRRAVVLLGAAAAVLLVPTACGDSGAGGHGDGGSHAATGPHVQVENFTYTPSNLTVPLGATVTWTFEDSAKHDVVAADKSFSSPLHRDGETYQFTFTRSGSYAYTCSIHPDMTGTVTVQ